MTGLDPFAAENLANQLSAAEQAQRDREAQIAELEDRIRQLTAAQGQGNRLGLVEHAQVPQGSQDNVEEEKENDEGNAVPNVHNDLEMNDAASNNQQLLGAAADQ